MRFSFFLLAVPLLFCAVICLSPTTDSVEYTHIQKDSVHHAPPGMVYIPGGSVVHRKSDSSSVKRFVKPFFMDSTEITQKEFKRLMGFNPSYFDARFITFFEKIGLKKCDIENRPVESVTWFDAALYCNERSKEQGKDTVYLYDSCWVDSDGHHYFDGIDFNFEADGYRLPFETEWEYACRAGTDGDRYGDIDRIAWYNYTAWYEERGYNDARNKQIHPVAQKMPNAFGLYDMFGNAAEWCGPSPGLTAKGGHWGSEPYSCKVGKKVYGLSPYEAYNTIGFRAVCN